MKGTSNIPISPTFSAIRNEPSVYYIHIFMTDPIVVVRRLRNWKLRDDYCVWRLCLRSCWDTARNLQWSPFCIFPIVAVHKQPSSRTTNSKCKEMQTGYSQNLASAFKKQELWSIQIPLQAPRVERGSVGDVILSRTTFIAPYANKPLSRQHTASSTAPWRWAGPLTPIKRTVKEW